jgi:ecotin
MQCFRTAVLLLILLAPLSQAEDNLKAFPPAEPGMQRHVLQLPPHALEDDLRVELKVGKTLELDPHNRYFFGSQLETVNIEGWGFSAFRLAELGPMTGTLMAVDPAVAKVPRFVALGGDPLLIRYNSRLPVVVYVPEGVEVRFRIWAAAQKTFAVEQG